MTEKLVEDHNYVTFELKGVEKIFVWYSIIGTILLLIFANYMSRFDGVWIMGMPRSVFGVFIIGVLCMIVVPLHYFAYLKHFSILLKGKNHDSI